jgi:hypothetical protein
VRGISVPDACFGIKTTYGFLFFISSNHVDGSVAECVRPSSREGSGAGSEPWTQTRRNYSETFDSSMRMGNPTPHDDAGLALRKVMTWTTVVCHIPRFFIVLPKSRLHDSISRALSWNLSWLTKQSDDGKQTRVRSAIDEDFHAQRDHPLGRSPGIKEGECSPHLLATNISFCPATLLMFEVRPFSPAKPAAKAAGDSAATVIYMRNDDLLDVDARRTARQSLVSCVRQKLKRAGFEKFGCDMHCVSRFTVMSV